MAEISFEQCFNTIGIQNGDTFEVARKAYKKQMHRLHPDRYPNDPAAQKTATDQFIQIQRCFQMIEEHFLIYGEMPFIAPEFSDEEGLPYTELNDSQLSSRSKELNNFEEELLSKASELNADSGAYYETNPLQHHGKNKEKTSSAGELGAGLFIIGILAYFFLNPPTQKFWEKPKEPSKHNLGYTQQEKKMHESVTNTKMTNSSLDINTPSMNSNISAFGSPEREQLSEEKLKAKELLSKTQRRLMETQSGQSFTFGSSFKDVAAIHGAPDISENDTWYYDKSKVVFQDGLVIDWKSDPSYPLATRLK